MSTGNGSKSNGKAATVNNRATGLRFEKVRLVIMLIDGREVSVPLRLYPSLQKAKPSQRNNWELIGDGLGFHWHEMDLDLSTDGLVNGIPEAIPRPPSRRMMAHQASILRSRRKAG